jgi:hypothetical protein
MGYSLPVPDRGEVGKLHSNKNEICDQYFSAGYREILIPFYAELPMPVGLQDWKTDRFTE